MKKIYVLFMSSLLLLSCAKDDVSKPSEWPEWPTPSKPKIENAVLRGVNGETVVAAGDKGDHCPAPVSQNPSRLYSRLHCQRRRGMPAR